MLISRTPLRITLGGGGTDLTNGSGYCITAAIDRHITIAVNNPFTNEYILRYSAIERVKSVENISHRIIRDCLQHCATPPGIEISSMADIPSGTGLGSSGAFTVGLLRALLPDASRPELAQIACQLDIGQQDQHSAVYGGVHAYDFAARTLRPIHTNLDQYLQLFYTGVRRETLLHPPMAVDPDVARIQADAALAALEGNDPHLLGACLTEQWQSKLAVQPSDFHRSMDRALNSCRAMGALGGKLVGAGNGGFLLIVGDLDPKTMARSGLTHVPFSFAREGTTLL